MKVDTLTLPRSEVTAILILLKQRRAGIRHSTSPGAREMDRIIGRIEKQMTEAFKEVVL